MKPIQKIIITAIIAIMIMTTATQLAGAMSLRMGMTGSDVREMQAMLRDLGYNISTDGIYGPSTKRAVMKFQQQNKLVVDGIAGPQTRNILSHIYEDQSYQVRKGDTLSTIARRYRVDVSTIRKANNLRNNTIYAGQRLQIPVLPSRGSRSRRSTSLIWPVQGRLSSPYGWRTHPITNERQMHAGLDIAASKGTPVKAAAGGTIFYRGWVSGFGWTIIIDHGNGMRTLYGHNSKLLVKYQQHVSAGQTIALVGSTGRSTGPHLDFRVYVDGKTVNPMNYLQQ